MFSFDILDVSIIVLMATVGAGILVWLVLLAGRQTQKVRKAPARSKVSLLLDGEDLLDASPDARQLLAAAPDKLGRRQALLHVLDARFPDLAAALTTLGSAEKVRVASKDNSSVWIMVEDIAGRTRVTLHGDHTAETDRPDTLVQDAMTQELTFLRKVADMTPQQIWQQDSLGNLTWANQAYLAMSDKVIDVADHEISAWPTQPVFDDLHHDVPEGRTTQRRVSVRLPDQKTEDWFDVTSVANGDTTLHFASDANSAVVAEQSRKTLMQTVSRAFAHLSIGLAIFDHKRQLSIFNPALHDLTGMPPEFLTGRPTLDMFLDNLRESQMLPEPKNYASWRDQFKALEAAARAGSYSEVWNLPSGLTYRVTGKPYANGAFAFFFEDISAEVALTRRFRSDIETGQHVLDTMQDAIAVFSSSGAMVMSNTAYRKLWGQYDADLVEREDIRTEIEAWRRLCAASPPWSDLTTFVGALGDRTNWSDTAILDDGRQVLCTAKPLPNSLTLVTFQLPQQTSPSIQLLTRQDPALMVGKR